MKKAKLYLGLTIMLLLLGVVLTLSFKIFKRQQEKQMADQQKIILPNFTFFTVDGNKIDNTVVKNGENVFLVFFDPECDFCMNEIKEITQNIEKIPQTKVILVSEAETEKIRLFIKNFSLSSYPNIVTLHDKANTFRKLFGSVMVPSLFIYNRNRKLIKEYHGETKFSSLLVYLNK